MKMGRYLERCHINVNVNINTNKGSTGWPPGMLNLVKWGVCSQLYLSVHADLTDHSILPHPTGFPPSIFVVI